MAEEQQFLFQYPIRAILRDATRNADGTITRHGTLCVEIDGEEAVAVFTDYDLTERFANARQMGAVQVMAMNSRGAFCQFLESELRHGAVNVVFDPPPNGTSAKFIFSITEAIKWLKAPPNSGKDE